MAKLKMTGPAAVVYQFIEETLSKSDGEKDEETQYVSPSSLAKGCVLYLAFDLLGKQKSEMETRVKRILNVGTSSHYRIPKYFSKLIVAKELFFSDEEYRIHGYCDALIYIPPELNAENSGFYVVEMKTTSSAAYQRIIDTYEPQEEHVRQCQLYIWGIKRHYKVIPINGGIIYYENRDTLESFLFNIEYQEAELMKFLDRVKAMYALVEKEQLPDDYLPYDHWAHAYCPYLDICAPGQKAIQQQKSEKKPLPDNVLADIIARKIVSKRRKDEATKKKAKAGRSLDELAAELNWS